VRAPTVVAPERLGDQRGGVADQGQSTGYLGEDPDVLAEGRSLPHHLGRLLQHPGGIDRTGPPASGEQLAHPVVDRKALGRSPLVRAQPHEVAGTARRQVADQPYDVAALHQLHGDRPALGRLVDPVLGRQRGQDPAEGVQLFLHAAQPLTLLADQPTERGLGREGDDDPGADGGEPGAGEALHVSGHLVGRLSDETGQLVVRRG
jgi:hypothetical protein